LAPNIVAPCSAIQPCSSALKRIIIRRAAHQAMRIAAARAKR
jgi:hypothetical protein